MNDSELVQRAKADIADEWRTKGLERVFAQAYDQIYKQAYEVGVQLGRLLQARKILRQQLRCSFGKLPKTITERIEQADQATLDAWIMQSLGAKSLKALFPDD